MSASPSCYAVERLEAKRFHSTQGLQVLVKWTGYDESTWEPVINVLPQCFGQLRGLPDVTEGSQVTRSLLLGCEPRCRVPGLPSLRATAELRSGETMLTSSRPRLRRDAEEPNGRALLAQGQLRTITVSQFKKDAVQILSIDVVPVVNPLAVKKGAGTKRARDEDELQHIVHCTLDGDMSPIKLPLSSFRIEFPQQLIDFLLGNAVVASCGV
jgi:hypothetical protein